MTSEEVLLEKIKVLPPEKKREVLDFVEFLERKESGETNAAIDEVFATRRELLERLAEGAE